MESKKCPNPDTLELKRKKENSLIRHEEVEKVLKNAERKVTCRRKRSVQACGEASVWP